VTVVNKSDGISAGCRLQELEQVPSAYLQALLHHAEEVEGEEDKNDEEASETSDAADDQPGEDRETDLLPLYSVANLHPCLLQAVGVANLCFFCLVVYLLLLALVIVAWSAMVDVVSGLCPCASVLCGLLA